MPGEVRIRDLCRVLLLRNFKHAHVRSKVLIDTASNCRSCLTMFDHNRISQLNAGQLRLLIRFVENKVPGLTNTTVLDAYTNLLRKAAVERHKRHEEEVKGCLQNVPVDQIISHRFLEPVFF